MGPDVPWWWQRDFVQASPQKMTEPAIRILLAEDNEGDVYLVRRALEKQGLAHQLIVARNGEDALRMLMDAEKGPAGSLPDLILLDLNLPRVDGGQILSRVRRTTLFDPRR